MANALQLGSKAPDFDLAADGGQRLRLSDLKGQITVLYFYPKDDTSGCTREAIEFTEAAPEFEAAGARVVGVSKDSAASHDKFKAKHQLKVSLASDTDGEVVEAYGVWVEKSMYGRTYMGIERATFLIDRNGAVQRVWRKVKASGHAAEVLNAVRELNQS